MKIYHGTSNIYTSQILKEGLIPRSTRTNGNWEKHVSRDDLVYLTTAYPWFFAMNTSSGVKDRDARAVVFEIDSAVITARPCQPRGEESMPTPAPRMTTTAAQWSRRSNDSVPVSGDRWPSSLPEAFYDEQASSKLTTPSQWQDGQTVVTELRHVPFP